MEKLAKILILINCMLLSSVTNGQSVIDLTNAVIGKIESCKTISHHVDQKWGNIGDSTDFTPNSGKCSFRILPQKTVINGYYHLELKDVLIDIFDGKKLARADLKEKTLTVTDIKTDRDTNSISSKMLYRQSVLEVYNILLDVRKNNYKKVSLIGDTIIKNVKCKRLSILTVDTIINSHRNLFRQTIAIDPNLKLPIHFLSTSISVYGVQLIETTISEYIINKKGLETSFDLLDQQYRNLTKVNYEEKKRQPNQFRLNVGVAAPDFLLKSTNGDMVALSSYRGKVILVEFSGVHCGFCLVAVKDLKKINANFDPKKFALISIYSDETESNLKKHVTRYNIDYLSLYNGNGLNNNQKLLSQYGVSGIPHFFVINQEGVVTWNSVGYFEDLYQSIFEEVNKLL